MREQTDPFFGTGTEKAEESLRTLCEGIRPLRMDQDTTARKFSHEKIMRAFRSGEYNVLLGTQMVAKGHDVPNVTLVGILSADSTLNLPDFRSGERCFALLTQAAGRAGRGDKPGRVIFRPTMRKILSCAWRPNKITYPLPGMS